MVKSSMNEIERRAADAGPVVRGGGRSSSTLSTGQGASSAGGAAPLGPLAPGQRWSVARKREVVLRLLRGEPTEMLSRELGLPTFKLEQWRRKAEAALDSALKAETPPPASGQRYGVQRVCRAWGMPRSSFYAARQPKPGGAEQRPPARRGPKPATSDEALLAAIRKDL